MIRHLQTRNLTNQLRFDMISFINIDEVNNLAMRKRVVGCSSLKRFRGGGSLDERTNEKALRSRDLEESGWILSSELYVKDESECIK